MNISIFSGNKTNQFTIILKCTSKLSLFMFFTSVLFIQILISMPLNDFGRQRNRVPVSQTPWIPSSGDPCSFSASHRWSELNFCLSILISNYLPIFPSHSNPTLRTTPNMHFSLFEMYYLLLLLFFGYGFIQVSSQWLPISRVERTFLHEIIDSPTSTF